MHVQFFVVISVQRSIISSFVGDLSSSIALATRLSKRSACCLDFRASSVIFRSCCIAQTVLGKWKNDEEKMRCKELKKNRRKREEKPKNRNIRRTFQEQHVAMKYLGTTQEPDDFRLIISNAPVRSSQNLKIKSSPIYPSPLIVLPDSRNNHVICRELGGKSKRSDFENKIRLYLFLTCSRQLGFGHFQAGRCM